MLLGFLCVAVLVASHKHSIKIVAGVEPKPATATATNEPDPPVPARLPDEPSGTQALYEKALGKCFNTTGGEFEYTVCPFTNVTLKQRTGYNRFWGLLGMYAGWKTEGGKFKRMIFDSGDSCAGASNA